MEKFQIRTYMEKLHLTNKRVAGKAEEFMRLAKIRSPTTGEGDICRPIICISLACKVLLIPFPREEGIRISTASKKVYQSTHEMMQNILQIKVNESALAQSLASHFQCPQLQKPSERTLRLYKQRFSESLPDIQKRNVDFSKPVFMAVALFLACLYKKIKIDKTELINFIDSNRTEFNKIYISMLELVYQKKLKRTDNSRLAELNAVLQKRKREELECEEIENEDEIGLRPKKQRMEEYESWKKSVLGQQSTALPPSQTKQTTLFSAFKNQSVISPNVHLKKQPFQQMGQSERNPLNPKPVVESSNPTTLSSATTSTNADSTLQSSDHAKRDVILTEQTKAIEEREDSEGKGNDNICTQDTCTEEGFNGWM